MFFALQPCTDPFPAEVHRLADFPSIAPGAGVTDIHIVFLNLALAVLGVPVNGRRPAVPGERGDLSLHETVLRWGMRQHVTVYPGGGCVPGLSPVVFHELGNRVTTLFTSVPDVRSAWPDAVPTSVPVATTFYTPPEADAGDPLRLAFVGDDRPRKGLAVLLEALQSLEVSWTLDVVGPHSRHGAAMSSLGSRVTDHGWLEPSQLRSVLRRCNVLVAPASRDLPSDGYGDVGMVDGFPTTAALVGMLSGCCLVGTNPGNALSPLVADEDWVAVPERDPVALTQALRGLSADPARRRAVAACGRQRVVSSFDVRTVVDAKLQRMGLTS